MQVNKNYEVELNLKDLLFHILYKWWIVLLVGILVAGILANKEYWSYEKYHRAGELAPAEIQYEADVVSYRKSLERAEEVLAEYEAISKSESENSKVSILMGIDPTSIWTAVRKYYVDTEVSVGDVGKKTLAVLSESFSKDIEDEKLIEVFGTSVRRDIIYVASICIDKEMNTISVIGSGATKEQAIERRDFVESYLKKESETLSKETDHKLILLSDNVGTNRVLITRDLNGEKVESSLLAIQKSLNEDYQNFQNQINVYTKNRNDLLNNSPQKPEAKIKEKVLFGFVLGAGAIIILLTVYYLLNGKLKTGDELRKRYNALLLSDFSHSRALWKGKGVDWIIEKLEYGNRTDPENELDNIASLMDVSRDGKSVLFTGTLGEKETKRIYEGLKSRLQEKGIELIFQPEYLHNSKAVALSGQSDSVLLAEEKYKSRIRDLNQMTEMLNIENAKVIGTILL